MSLDLGKDNFGIPSSRDIRETKINKYVSLHSKTTTKTFVGRLKEFKNGFYILNPFQGIKYSENKPPKLVMVKEDFPIESSNIYAIQPTTKKNVENYCVYSNKQNSKKPNNSK